MCDDLSNLRNILYPQVLYVDLRNLRPQQSLEKVHRNMQYSADAVLSSPVLASSWPQFQTIPLEPWFELCEDLNRRYASTEVTHEAAELRIGSMDRRRRPWRASL